MLIKYTYNQGPHSYVHVTFMLQNILHDTDEMRHQLPESQYFHEKLIWVCLFVLAQKPQVGQGLLIHEVSTSRSHTTTHHTRKDSSGRVISSSQGPLPDTHNTHNRQTSVLPVEFEPTISVGERP